MIASTPILINSLLISISFTVQAKTSIFSLSASLVKPPAKVIISLIFVLTNNFHKVRYTIVTDPYGTEFVYDRFTGKLKKKITY